jgi:hypothetical protein
LNTTPRLRKSEFLRRFRAGGTLTSVRNLSSGQKRCRAALATAVQKRWGWQTRRGLSGRIFGARRAAKRHAVFARTTGFLDSEAARARKRRRRSRFRWAAAGKALCRRRPKNSGGAPQ